MRYKLFGFFISSEKGFIAFHVVILKNCTLQHCYNSTYNICIPPTLNALNLSTYEGSIFTFLGAENIKKNENFTEN